MHLMLLISWRKLEIFYAEFLNYLFVGFPHPLFLESEIRFYELKPVTTEEFFHLRFTLKKLIQLYL